MAEDSLAADILDAGGAIAVMDGDCALCTRGARMIHRLDRSGTIRIAPMQGATGAALMRRHGVDPDDPSTWLLIEAGGVARDFDAVIRVGERTGGPGRVLALLRLVPAPLRARLYAWVARNRRRIMGRADICALPDPAFRARLLP